MIKNNKNDAALTTELIDNEKFFKISNVDQLRPFLMSIVSDSNHWMFISSNTGLSAGRKNAQFSLFPYTTDDKITDNAEVTGCKSIFRIGNGSQINTWEPFSIRDEGKCLTKRNIYKSHYGNKIIFEEINVDLELSFSFEWESSKRFGFVKSSKLINHSDKNLTIDILDGIQNLMPAGVNSELQNSRSNLVDAYKRSELDTTTKLAIYALSAFIVDRAEPSEALKANIAWSLGLEGARTLLSSSQLQHFRRGNQLKQEEDIKAERGAYFLNHSSELLSGNTLKWRIIADVNQSHKDVAHINKLLLDKKELEIQLDEDISRGTQRLIQLVAASDGIQITADPKNDARHFSNVLFNIMRGGIFDNNYQIKKDDFANYIHQANRLVFSNHSESIHSLPDIFNLAELNEHAQKSVDSDYKRLCNEYLPLKFSRRHGDPSRPWNVFSINITDEITGSEILDYEGNWRDIFQNWEALAMSYPDFISNMIHKFLNASTFDGYNPYRVTKDGFDWETIEENNPWSYIGYWGDHQIIYLLKFLEFIEKVSPGNLEQLFNQDVFVYANVPYKLKDYHDILKNPKSTIIFDTECDLAIQKRRQELGSDGALIQDKEDKIYHVNFIEKILATTLAKVSNFILEGGIWMNTQRPEWNDANNALVGNGVSMVTLYYLYRFFKFFQSILSSTDSSKFLISDELLVYFHKTNDILAEHTDLLAGTISNQQRKILLDQLGTAASDYRNKIYENSYSNQKSNVELSDIKSFFSTTLLYLEHSIIANKRSDGLFHAYNLMDEFDDEVDVSHLYEMLEGQVAVISSGFLKTPEVLEVLDGLKQSKLFREDQYSYLLYPNKELLSFRNKNRIAKSEIESSLLLQHLIQANDQSIINCDIEGTYHFNATFRNADILRYALDQLILDDPLLLSESEKEIVLNIYETIFNHKSFTGRSGTFFGYEGLGSIYWHMVSKLRLAVYECCVKAINQDEDPVLIGKMLAHYYEINEGIGVHKSPELYGAFPTDPYSHTPANKGAQQPGMTGQVKEDVIARFGELGLTIHNGCLGFFPHMLRLDEFLDHPTQFIYFNTDSISKTIKLPSHSLGFTISQIPIIYTIIKDEPYIEVKKTDHTTIKISGPELDTALSKAVFSRKAIVDQIFVHINAEILK